MDNINAEDRVGKLLFVLWRWSRSGNLLLCGCGINANFNLIVYSIFFLKCFGVSKNC